MWHEARRQERKIRGMLVDYRRRAERRRDFYEKIKADPTQFLQVHGRQCKIHLDPTVAAAADAAVMMPWQGHTDNLIDRFDVRAHLDIIPNPPRRKKGDDGDEDLADYDGSGAGGDEEEEEERHLNYERYRIIAQNSFLGVSEEKFLRQLHLEEQFGYASEGKGKRGTGGSGSGGGGVAIGYSYDEGGSGGAIGGDQHHESEGEDSDSDLDVDLAINVSKMDPAQAHEMNAHGRRFGMSSNDFYSFLTNDLEEWETYKLAKEEEQEKALFSGRRSRRERRYHREKRLANRKISPPSYAAQASPSLPNLRESKSASRSPTPENSGKITYITSFGDDEETPSTTNTKPTYADKVKSSGRSTKIEDKRGNRSRRSRSRSDRSRRRRSRSRSRSRSRRSKSRRRSRSRRSRSKRRSRSRSRKRFRRSRSRSGSRYKSYRRKRSTSSSSSSSRKSFIAPPGTVPYEIPRRSPLKVKEEEKGPPIDVPKVIPRYYGRKKSDYSSSDLTSDGDDAEETKNPTYKTLLNDSKSGNGNSSGTSTKYKAISSTPAMNTINVATTSTNMTVIERLKRKRQALLNRQFKADKMAEQLKTEREKQEQQTREDELREMAIRLRRRQRELRHAYDSRSSSSSSSSSSESSRSSSSKASNSAKQVSVSSKHTSYSSRRSRSRERSRNSREPERRSTVGPRDRRRDEEKGSERREKRLVDY